MRIAARLDRGEITQEQAERLLDEASVVEPDDYGTKGFGPTPALTGEAAARARARVLAREMTDLAHRSAELRRLYELGEIDDAEMETRLSHAIVDELRGGARRVRRLAGARRDRPNAASATSPA